MEKATEADQAVLDEKERLGELELGSTAADCLEAAKVLVSEAERLKEKEKSKLEEKKKTLAKNIRQISLLLAESNSIAINIGDIAAIEAAVSLSDATSRLSRAMFYELRYGR